MTQIASATASSSPSAPSPAPSLPVDGPLPYTAEVAEATADVRERLRDSVPDIEWPIVAPLIARINALKRERNAIILAHNYMPPNIYHGVADLRGDSLALAQMASTTSADVIVLCGVHFMAETAAIINPTKTVLIPDLRAGCSLAESITGADVRRIRALHPGVPVVTYVNTSAEVKAESDICCTSANAVEVVESLGVDRVIFLPDEYLAAWVATQTSVEIIDYKGHCMVHERFTAADVHALRAVRPGVLVLSHPESPPEVLAVSDFVGSTSAMIKLVAERRPAAVALMTECSMSDNVAEEFPELDFIRPCQLCPHMGRITLPKVRRSLETMTHRVTVEPALAERARRAVERMLEVGRGARG